MSRTERECYNRAYVSGTFDCLHRGHLNLFAEAHKWAIEIVVSVNTDEFAARYKRQPMMPLADRVAVLQQCKLVDQVVVNVGDEDSKIAIVSADVDCIIHGDDWPIDTLLPQMGLTREWLTAVGISMLIVPYTHGVSTTELLQRYIDAGSQVSKRDPDYTTCRTCGRSIHVTHMDANGDCSLHATSTGHESVGPSDGVQA